MKLFSAEPMRMWPMSTRVNKPENDDTLIIEPLALASVFAISGAVMSRSREDKLISLLTRLTLVSGRLSPTFNNHF